MNCTVCGWPQVVRDGDHAWWCQHITRQLRDGTYDMAPTARRRPTIDFDDVLARRRGGESFATIAAAYHLPESTLYKQWNRWTASVA